VLVRVPIQESFLACLGLSMRLIPDVITLRKYISGRLSSGFVAGRSLDWTKPGTGSRQVVFGSPVAAPSRLDLNHPAAKPDAAKPGAGFRTVVFLDYGQSLHLQ
jgi:hypothetical protein